jgi:predicted dehydrogenase
MRSESLYQEKTFGALLMDYAHQPDLLFWWLRKSPTSVRAVGYECGEMPLSADPNVVAMTLQYDSPVIATINLNFAQHPGNSHCEVVGDEGWIFFDMSTGKMRIGNRDDAAVEERVFPLDRDRLFQDEQQAFLDAVHGRRQPESPAKHAIQSMIVVEAAIRSLRP